MNKMTKRVFLDTVHEEYDAGQRYCFILGSGASATSKIRMGSELLKDWFNYLTAPDKGLQYAKERAELIGLTPNDYDYLFQPGYKPEGKDYFVLYDLRYAGSPNAGFQALEKEMAGKSPNVGYYLLASLLEHTENRYVITTNFDSLTEDAYFYYTGNHPLVVGHESLAPFIGGNIRRPVIAKIHRDLYLNPKNHKKEMEQLSDEWEKPLTKLLSQYIPIVIGYAGEDQSLMSLLAKIRLSGIFWCTRPGKEPSERAKKIIEDNNGNHVVIDGFDEILFDLTNRLTPNPDPDSGTPMGGIRSKMQKSSENRLDNLTKTLEKFSNNRTGKNDAHGTPEDKNSTSGEMNSEPNPSGGVKPKNPMIPYMDTLSAYKDNDFESALHYIDEAISLKSDNARFHKLRGDILDDMNRKEEAFASYDKAIKLDPDFVDAYYNRGILHHDLDRPEEALSDYSKAIELDPHDASTYNNRANILCRLNRSEEALTDYNTAIELDPHEMIFYFNRGLALHDLNRLEEALADYNRAIKLDPDFTFTFNSDTASPILNRTEEILIDFNKFIDLKSDFAPAYFFRGHSLRNLNRLQEALADFTKAAELDPANPDYANARDELQQQLNPPS